MTSRPAQQPASAAHAPDLARQGGQAAARTRASDAGPWQGISESDWLDRVNAGAEMLRAAEHAGSRPVMWRGR